MCEFCPVVARIECSVCGYVSAESNGVIVIPLGKNATVQVDGEGARTVRVKPTRYRHERYQQCGGGRRVIRKRIGGD